jgi:nickel/cobalt transporter (NicO) family protein
VFLASSALALGFLHGLGADHLMAIAALSIGAPGTARRARTFRIAVSFALGHAILLAAGSTLIIVAGWTVPVLVERTGEIAGGCILIALGLASLWIAITQSVYGHVHPQVTEFQSAMRKHWHLHVGPRAHHPLPQDHSFMPAVLGAAFAVSGLRALTLLTPAGTHAGSFIALMGLILIFAIGILLSMSLFGIVLVGLMGAARVTAWAGRAAVVITASASFGLGAYWVFWR